MHRIASILTAVIGTLAASAGIASASDCTPKDLLDRRVMVLGDSITQQGSWVGFLEYYLLRDHPAAQVDIVSIGLASETASGLSEDDHPFPRPCLHERLGRALEAVQPEVVIACYGMNDGIYHPSSPEREEAFHNGILKLVRTSRDHGAKKILLLTPGTFSGTRTVGQPPYGYKTPYVGYNEVLAGYARWLMNLDEPGVTAVDIHTPMRRYEQARRKKNSGFRLAGDGIHPGALGHLIMARAALAGLGVPLPDDFDKELATVTADPLYRLVDRHRRTRSEGWLPFVGYTRGKPVKAEEIDATEATCAGIMTQIDEVRRAK